MHFLAPFLLALVPSALAIRLDTPKDAKAGSPLHLTWATDPSELDFYATTNFRSFTPVGFANTTDEETELHIGSLKP